MDNEGIVWSMRGTKDATGVELLETMRRSIAGRILALATLSLILPIDANAQWTVKNLHPDRAEALWSYAYGVGGNKQVGVVGVGYDRLHASLWSGAGGTWVDLNPAGAVQSWAYGVADGQQVGSAYVNGRERASLWMGTAASWVELAPAGAESQALGVHRGQQVGWVDVSGWRHASLWTGSADSWVDLHPAKARFSYAYGVHDGNQAGVAFVPYGSYRAWPRASLWKGTAGSWVNLNPAGAVESEAWDVHDGQQVGYADVGGLDRASLWYGTAASWVDLTPALATRSYAYGVHSGRQVGFCDFGGGPRASLWTGTADSWVNLHAFLPSNFSFSWAYSVTDDGTFTYVVGFGFNNATSRPEALMWVGPTRIPLRARDWRP